MRSNKAHDRHRLEQEIGGRDYRPLLELLQRHSHAARQFSSWGDYLAFMHAGTAADPVKQDLLHAIMQFRALDGDRRWQAVLLATFWPGLEALCRRKRRWDRDDQERWQNVLAAFMQSLAALDVAKRADRICPRIMSGTLHRLHDSYRRVWKIARRETPTAPEKFAGLLSRSEGLDFNAMDFRSRQAAASAWLRRCLDAGQISADDYDLILKTRLQNQSVAGYAQEKGLDGDGLRKRRRRVERAIIRAAEKKFKK